MTAFFHQEGEAFAPTALSANHWHPDAQSGVALGLLMSHTLQAQPEAANGRLARFTLDILRPAPALPTRVAWRLANSEGTVRLLEGELEAGGQVAARASALFVDPTAASPPAMPLVPPIAAPEDAGKAPAMARQIGLEPRFLSVGRLGPSGERTPHVLWLRLEADITPGVRASPISTAVAISDFGGSALGDYGSAWNFPNVDIAVHFARQPEGEWVQTRVSPLLLGENVGIIDHRLSDRRGPFAHAHQVMFFTRRETARS